MPTAKHPGWFVAVLCACAALWAIFGANPSAQAGFKFNSSGELVIAGGVTNVPISSGNLTSLDANLGATTDAAVTGDANGSVNAHIRFLSKVLNSAWDSGNNRLNVAVANGSATGTVGGTANTAYVSTVGADPCQSQPTKLPFTIDLASTTATKLISGTSAKKNYICSLQLVTATAQNIGIWSGTKVTTECDTGKGKMFGGSTAATGWNFAANGGITLGNGGYFIAVSGANADDVCITSSGSGQISGNGTYVVQ